MTKISVVLPAHNEADYLATTVADVVAGLESRGLDFEVVVVENGSTDRTAVLARELATGRSNLQVLSLTEADYGRALRTGLLAARGDLVVNFDVDYYDLDFVDRVTALMQTDTSATSPSRPAIIVGSKRAPGSSDTRSPARRLVTWVFSTILHVGFRLGVSDTHGIKALDRAQVTPLVEHCHFDADLFDTELVIRAQHAGLRVDELPITTAERRPSRTPVARRIPRTLWGLARLRVLLWRERA